MVNNLNKYKKGLFVHVIYEIFNAKDRYNILMAIIYMCIHRIISSIYNNEQSFGSN